MQKKPLCLLLLLILSACNGTLVVAPKVTECIISVEENGEASCICQDQRTDLPPEIRPIEQCNNYMATSPSDYVLLFNFTSDVVARLETCLKFPKRCK